MKINNFFFLMSLLFVITSCAVWKKYLSPQGDVDTAINNVITDFVNTSKLFKADTVFGIAITDKENYYVIGISGAVNKIYPRIEDVVGSKDEYGIFPTKYTIRQEKLFYWNDSNQPITQEVLDVLARFKHIDFEWRDWEYNIPLNITDGQHGSNLYIPPLVIDDGKEGVVYYVCKNNLTNYKKIGANTIRRHYNKEPKLKCND